MRFEYNSDAWPAIPTAVAEFPAYAGAATAPDPDYWDESCTGSTAAAATSPSRPRPPAGTAAGAAASASATPPGWDAGWAAWSRPGILPSPAAASDPESRPLGGSART